MTECHECRCHISPPCAACVNCPVCSPCSTCDEVHDGPRGAECTRKEPMTAAQFVFVSALCQFYNPYPGPTAWLCRYAWLTYQSGANLDVDQLIAQHADWLNRPENTETRANLVGCIDWLRHMAAKPPLCPLPDQSAFDASQWLTTEGTMPNDGNTPHNPRWTFSGPGRYEIEAVPDDDLSVRVELWHHPGRTEPEPPPPPAKWDGRPFPGKCSAEDCDNQATCASGYWDGGAPGQGTWRQTGRCPIHPHVYVDTIADIRLNIEPEA